jgi:hypothetical protein
MKKNNNNGKNTNTRKPDPATVLDYDSFWNKRGAIPPYDIPAQPPSTITQLQDSLNFCTDRIRRTRSPQV